MLMQRRNANNVDLNRDHGYMWEGSRILSADIGLNRKEAGKVLPRGMRLTDPPTATVYITDCVKTSFTVPYKEAGLMIHVRTLFGKGWH